MPRCTVNWLPLNAVTSRYSEPIRILYGVTTGEGKLAGSTLLGWTRTLVALKASCVAKVAGVPSRPSRPPSVIVIVRLEVPDLLLAGVWLIVADVGAVGGGVPVAVAIVEF